VVKLVIVESPFAGNVALNTEYARAALRDSLARGEAPIASHLLYTQVLNDLDPAEREQGISAGLARRRAPGVLPAFYIDLGWGQGMIRARQTYEAEHITYAIRRMFAGASVDRIVEGGRSTGVVW
jgi:hypothetical protein